MVDIIYNEDTVCMCMEKRIIYEAEKTFLSLLKQGFIDKNENWQLEVGYVVGGYNGNQLIRLSRRDNVTKEILANRHARFRAELIELDDDVEEKMVVISCHLENGMDLQTTDFAICEARTLEKVADSIGYIIGITFYSDVIAIDKVLTQ